MNSPARLHVDWTRCDGHGACAELLPDLLAVDDWGFPLSRSGPDPVVPEQLREYAERAVRDCPLMALRIVSEPRRR